MKPLPYREVKRKLEQAGFVEISQKGSHVKFAKELADETWTVIVPYHREVSPGTLRSILRQAGLSVDEFEEL
ncbi:type II toxin-antitoxin system HicA family toxin [Alkalinema pantanalense CENA528]|uniref:type II toxin-antitoxin system HicA family toxin n=1 Tax=Alkalinema pantanalense TaxID=1620705 RepID=UPI003D6E262A